jgi:hypothetical protein
MPSGIKSNDSRLPSDANEPFNALQNIIPEVLALSVSLISPMLDIPRILV